jgi:hypothetical protein
LPRDRHGGFGVRPGKRTEGNLGTAPRPTQPVAGSELRSWPSLTSSPIDESPVWCVRRRHR